MTANISKGKVTEVFIGKGGSHKVIVQDEGDYFNHFKSGKYETQISHTHVLASISESYVIIEKEQEDEDTVF